MESTPTPTWRSAAAVAALAAAIGMTSPLRAGEWIRTSFAGFEVYSDAPASDVEGVVRDVQLLDGFMRALWPQAAQAEARPITLIFLNERHEFLALNPHLVHPTLSGRLTEALLGDHPMMTLTAWRSGWVAFDRALGRDVSVNPLLAARLQRFYGQCFLRRVGERVPPWLYVGLRKLIDGAVCHDGFVDLPALGTDPTLIKRTANPRSDPGSSIRSGAFLPLDALFDGKPRELRRYPFKCSAQTLALYSGTIFPITRDHVIRSIPMDGTVAPFWATLPFGTFADESYEFVEWGLLGGGGRFRTAFTRFASAAANGPQDAADFQQCFGMNYAQALRLLWADTATAQPQSFRWQSNRPLPPRLKFVPVDARAAERLEQEWRDRIGFPGTRAQTEDPLSRIE